MGSHSKSRRDEAMKALRASADEHDGSPVFQRVAAEVGVPHTTLRRWWHARSGELHVIRSAPTDAPAPAAPAKIDPLTTPASVFYAWMFDEAVADIRDAREREAAPYVIAGMRPHLATYFEAARSAYQVEKDSGKRILTPEEREARVADLARSMSPADATVMLREFRARKMVS